MPIPTDTRPRREASSSTKAGTDLSQRLSDACVKITLVLLVLSAFALALTEKVQSALRFQSYVRVELAAQNLGLALADLAADRCWLSYLHTLPDPQVAGAMTLAQLRAIECNLAHDRMRINAALWASQAPSGVDPGTLPFLLPRAASPIGGQTAVGLGAAELLEHTLVPLWDDDLLNSGARYSVVAGDDIYHWELFRLRLVQSRSLPLIPEKFSTAGGVSESNFLKLTLDDLKDITRLAHPALSELDRAAHENLRASLPEVSIDLGVGNAAVAVAIACAIFSAILAAYVKAVIREGSLSTPGTVFRVMLGSPWSEALAMFVLLLPAGALYGLGNAIGWTTTGGVLVLLGEMGVLFATAVVVLHIFPHTTFANDFVRLRRRGRA